MEAHERCISSTSVSLNAYQERNTTTVVGTQESFLEPPDVLLEGTYAQNEMKRGAITTLPGLREAFIVSKKRMHSYRVTSRLLSTRSIRLKRCSTIAKDDTGVFFGAHRSARRFQSIVAFESVPVEEVYALHRPYMISSVPKLVFFSP